MPACLKAAAVQPVVVLPVVVAVAEEQVEVVAEVVVEQVKRPPVAPQGKPAVRQQVKPAVAVAAEARRAAVALEAVDNKVVQVAAQEQRKPRALRAVVVAARWGWVAVADLEVVDSAAPWCLLVSMASS